MGLAHPPIVAKADVVVGREPLLPLISVDQRFTIQCLVTGCNHSSFAAGHHLSWVEGECCCGSEAARWPGTQSRALRVRRILDQRHAHLIADFSDIAEVGTYDAPDMNEDHRSGVRVQTLTQAAYVERKAARLTVRKPHSSTGLYYRRRRRKKRIGWDDHFAALCRVPYAVAVNSGTSALEIILRAIGVGNTAEGREL